MKTYQSQLDATDWAILSQLQQNARLNFSELGRQVSLSAPAVQERIRKMEDAGIIKGYHLSLDLERIGLPIQALIQLSGSCRKSQVFIEAVDNIPEVMQCHHVLGDQCFYLHVAVSSMQHLESLIQSLYEYGETVTTIILSTQIERRTISPDNLA